MNCDNCKYYEWYYDHCSKWNCEVDARETHNCFEPYDTPIRDKMVNYNENEFLKLMNRDSGRVSIDEDKIRQAREIQKERHMNNKEKNPKQVLIDWVGNVQTAAVNGRNVIHNNNGLNRDQKLDKSSDYFERIIGQCETMMAVLNNSN